MQIVELSKPLKAIPTVSYSPATDRVADIIKTCSVSATSYTTAVVTHVCSDPGCR